MTVEALRAIAVAALGPDAARARITQPEQGINNRTYFIQPPSGPELALKVRPRARAGVRNSPQWPRYVQQLFGPLPNGDISTLTPITRDLARHGALRVPEIVHVDCSQEHIPAPFFLCEKLEGVPFDWDARPVQGAAACRLGLHLGRVHRATRQEAGFGIYVRPGQFGLGEWWPRFAQAYATLLTELARHSPTVAALERPLMAALARAVSAGPPEACVLICADQSPTHYLASPEGTISAMVDVEAHLWGPREYELATVELWARDQEDFRRAYTDCLPWPGVMEQVRPAYWFFTWMEWIYCLHTLLHDPEKAAALEGKFAVLCRQIMS